MRWIAIALSAAVCVTLIVRLTGGESGAAPPAAASQAPAVPLAVEQVAPSFELTAADAQRLKVGGPSPGWTVLTFYRAAGSPW